MRHVPNNKYTVAWFKLAEFVTRGEKERALGMYRLLMHSVNDVALALQLEGDLLCAFNDETAYEKYRAAAELYLQTARISEAAALYELLATGEVITFTERLVLADLYARQGAVQLFYPVVEATINFAQSMQDICLVVALVSNYAYLLSGQEIIEIFGNIVARVIACGNSEIDNIGSWLGNELRGLILVCDEKNRANFKDAIIFALEAEKRSEYELTVQIVGESF